MGILVAAAGYLPPLAGAVRQEAIDGAVILNALRALADGGTRRATLPATQVRLLHAEHGSLAGVLDRMRALADRLGIDNHSPGLQRELVDLVQDAQAVLAHERADEAELLPQLAQLMGGEDPMAAMSRTHQEIAHLGRRFARLVADLREDGPDPEEITELRRTLYALEAILRLHFAQEDELYDSVAGEVLRRLPAQA
jgi:hemerythrin-like domain-containing protein